MSQTDKGADANSKSGSKKSPNEQDGRKSLSDCQLLGVFVFFVLSLIFATCIGSWLGKFAVQVNIVDWFNVYNKALSSSSGSWTRRDLTVPGRVCADWRRSGSQQLDVRAGPAKPLQLDSTKLTWQPGRMIQNECIMFQKVPECLHNVPECPKM